MTSSSVKVFSLRRFKVFTFLISVLLFFSIFKGLSLCFISNLSLFDLDLIKGIISLINLLNFFSSGLSCISSSSILSILSILFSSVLISSGISFISCNSLLSFSISSFFFMIFSFHLSNVFSKSSIFLAISCLNLIAIFISSIRLLLNLNTFIKEAFFIL